MARKLLCLVALISLVSLTQAAPGLADTYQLQGLGSAAVYAWYDAYGPDWYPGTANRTFQLAFNGNFDLTDVQWGSQALMNPAPATFTVIDDGHAVEVKTVYTDRVGSSSTDPTFIAQNYGGPKITSNNIKITTTATFLYDPITNRLVSEENSVGTFFTVLAPITLAATGTNTLDGAQFSLSGQMVADYTSYGMDGHFTDLELTYPNAAHAPIPGAVWLLGSGLLGLSFLRPRRKS